MFIFSVSPDCELCKEEIDRLENIYNSKCEGGAIILPKGVRFLSNVNPKNSEVYSDDFYDPDDWDDEEDDDGTASID